MTLDGSYALLTTNLPLSIVILIVYSFFGCCLWSEVIIKRPIIGFTPIPWWGLVIARGLQAVFGILSSVSSNRIGAYHGYFELVYTYLWDTGLCIITFALLRTAAFSYRVKPLGKTDLVQYSWIFVAVTLETIGTAFAGIARFGKSFDSKYSSVFDGLLRAVLCMAIATLLSLTAVFGYALVVHRKRRHSSTTDLAVGIAFFPTLLLLSIRIGPDAVRLWLSRPPSLPLFIGAELVPEILSTAIWISLASVTTRWNHFRQKELLEIRAEKKNEWSHHLDDAISYAQAVQVKGVDMSHRKKPWILWVMETRFWNEEKHSSFLAGATGREEAVQMLRRLKVVAMAIAENLELEEDSRQPLLQRPSRAIDMKRTEKKVAEALVAQAGMTKERAEKVVREWVIIFVLDWRTFQPQSGS